MTPNPALITSDRFARVAFPVVDLMRKPRVQRDRQVLMGERLRVLGEHGDQRYVQAEKDGYIGFIPAAALRPDHQVTHRISALGTQVYQDANMKCPDRMSLSFSSLINVISTTDGFMETQDGFIPRQHTSPIVDLETDPVAVALKFLGTPYLWGGNSRVGIDCSGLVQTALLSCGLPCPGDSDQQEDSVGHALPENTPTRKGDLYFWKGHVAMCIDTNTLIHANAHHMSTALEPLAEAIARIASQGDGPVTAHKRL